MNHAFVTVKVEVIYDYRYRSNMFLIQFRFLIGWLVPKNLDPWQKFFVLGVRDMFDFMDGVGKRVPRYVIVVVAICLSFIYCDFQWHVEEDDSFLESSVTPYRMSWISPKRRESFFRPASCN